MPLENVLTFLFGFSLLLSVMLLRYPRSITLMTEEAIEDKNLKALSAFWLLYLILM
jgi:hypothetical protein